MSPDARFAALRVVEPSLLAGDASTRRYYRGTRDGASVVVMDCGAPIAEGDAFPFTRWRAEYAELGIRVPALIDGDPARGLLVLEDLGDETLQARIERAGADACRGHYERAVEWGLRLAIDGTPRFRPDDAMSDDPLLPKRLALEMDLFLVHAGRLALDPATADLPALRRAAQALDGASVRWERARLFLHELCEDVHGREVRPMVLCHRDYHARNLLLVPGTDRAEEVAVIDFQDTRRGPRAYDLASLAWDPYVTLPARLVGDLVEAWRPRDAARDEWSEEVALAAGQRLLKAAGSYAWLGHACGRTHYLQWLAPALSRAHERLACWPLRESLWDALRECGVET